MIPLERKSKILDLLKANKNMTVEQIASRIYVSQMTVRRDIKQLEAENLVKRIRGGVEIIEFTDRQNSYYSYAMRMNLQPDGKRQIAAEAAKRIENGDTIYIDTSSTASYIADYIDPKMNITIITSSVNTAKKLAERNIPHTLVGGLYHELEMSLLGNISEKCVENFYIDKMFFSSQGVVPGDYIYDSNEAETKIRQIFLKKSKKKYFLCVKYKIGRKYMFRVCPADSDIEIISGFTEGGESK